MTNVCFAIDKLLKQQVALWNGTCRRYCWKYIFFNGWAFVYLSSQDATNVNSFCVSVINTFYFEWNQGGKKKNGTGWEWQIIAGGTCVLFPPPKWIMSRWSLWVRDRKERACHFCQLVNSFAGSQITTSRTLLLIGISLFCMGSPVSSLLPKTWCRLLDYHSVWMSVWMVSSNGLVSHPGCILASCPVFIHTSCSAFLGLAPDSAQLWPGQSS